MINKMNKRILRELLDKVGYRTSVDEDGDFYVILSADDAFDHDVIIYYSVNEETGRLRVMGQACDFDVTSTNMAKAVLTCNKYNSEHLYIVASVGLNGRIVADYSVLLDEEVSEKFIIENCIKLPASLIWKFFCSFNGNK